MECSPSWYGVLGREIMFWGTRKLEKIIEVQNKC
jgi:hypothetical protein